MSFLLYATVLRPLKVIIINGEKATNLETSVVAYLKLAHFNSLGERKTIIKFGIAGLNDEIRKRNLPVIKIKLSSITIIIIIIKIAIIIIIISIALSIHVQL